MTIARTQTILNGSLYSSWHASSSSDMRDYSRRWQGRFFSRRRTEKGAVEFERRQITYLVLKAAHMNSQFRREPLNCSKSAYMYTCGVHVCMDCNEPTPTGVLHKPSVVDLSDAWWHQCSITHPLVDLAGDNIQWTGVCITSTQFYPLLSYCTLCSRMASTVPFDILWNKGTNSHTATDYRA